jgi:hypothetical protein
MLNEMTLTALTGFYGNMAAADLRELDNKGGLLAWSQGRGFEVSYGCPSDRAMHEQIDGLSRVEIADGSQEFRSTAKQTRAWLLDGAEAHLDSLEEQLDERRGE